MIDTIILAVLKISGTVLVVAVVGFITYGLYTITRDAER
jgi:hypothetical protein